MQYKCKSGLQTTIVLQTTHFLPQSVFVVLFSSLSSPKAIWGKRQRGKAECCRIKNVLWNVTKVHCLVLQQKCAHIMQLNNYQFMLLFSTQNNTTRQFRGRSIQATLRIKPDFRVSHRHKIAWNLLNWSRHAPATSSAGVPQIGEHPQTIFLSDKCTYSHTVLQNTKCGQPLVFGSRCMVCLFVGSWRHRSARH
jgi:hypothetical protein